MQNLNFCNIISKFITQFSSVILKKLKKPRNFATLRFSCFTTQIYSRQLVFKLPDHCSDSRLPAPRNPPEITSRLRLPGRQEDLYKEKVGMTCHKTFSGRHDAVKARGGIGNTIPTVAFSTHGHGRSTQRSGSEPWHLYPSCRLPQQSSQRGKFSPSAPRTRSLVTNNVSPSIIRRCGPSSERSPDTGIIISAAAAPHASASRHRKLHGTPAQ